VAVSNRSTAAAGVSILLALAACGCAPHHSVRWDHPVVVSMVPSAGPIFVMEPLIAGTASPGNVGRDFAAIKAGVVTRIVSIVRERFPRTEVADSRAPAGTPMPAGYRLATGEPAVTAEELNAAGQAWHRGATQLLVPTITEWRQMRTDDPIGALTLPRNSITVTLRLMRLEPPVLIGQVTFRNRAHLTLNQPAIRLLDDRFREATLRLVSGG
jgi:hypothetical protein